MSKRSGNIFRASAFNGNAAAPLIGCYSQATTPLGQTMAKVVHALQTYVNKHVAPVWGTKAKLIATTGPVAGAWGLVFLDDADHAGALGYHNVTSDGMPLAKVFVRDALKAGVAVSITASHELVEMLVDPAINLLATGGPDAAAAYAYEAADPVESETFVISKIPVSNFVYPAYFESFRAAGSTKFDHLGTVTAPFQVRPGGHQSVIKNGQWTDVLGARAAQGGVFASRRFGRTGVTNARAA